MKIVNYKASVKIRCKKCIQKLQLSLVSVNRSNRSKNFTVGSLPDSDCRLILFHTGHLNVTRIRQIRELEELVARLANLSCRRRACVGNDNAIKDYRIDNITASGRVIHHDKLPLDLHRVLSAAAKLEQQTVVGKEEGKEEDEEEGYVILKCQYDRENFPGLKLWTRFGTILLFNSGKYVLTGVKEERHLNLMVRVISRLICRAECDDLKTACAAPRRPPEGGPHWGVGSKGGGGGGGELGGDCDFGGVTDPPPPFPPGSKSYASTVNWPAGVDMLERVCFNYHFPECIFQSAVLIYNACIGCLRNRNKLRGHTTSTAAAALYISCCYHEEKKSQPNICKLFDIARDDLWRADKVLRAQCKISLPLVHRKITGDKLAGKVTQELSRALKNARSTKKTTSSDADRDGGGSSKSSRSESLKGSGRDKGEEQIKGIGAPCQLTHAGMEKVAVICAELGKEYSCRYATLAASVACLVARTRCKVVKNRRQQRRRLLGECGRASARKPFNLLSPLVHEAPQLKSFADAAGASTNSVSRQISKILRASKDGLANIKRLCLDDSLFICNPPLDQETTKSKMAQAQLYNNQAMSQQQQHQQQHQQQQQQLLESKIPEITDEEFDLAALLANGSTPQPQHQQQQQHLQQQQQQHQQQQQPPQQQQQQQQHNRQQHQQQVALIQPDPACSIENTATISMALPPLTGSWVQDPQHLAKRVGPLYNITDHLQCFVYDTVLTTTDNYDIKYTVRKLQVRKTYNAKDGSGEKHIHIDIHPSEAKMFLTAVANLSNMIVQNPNTNFSFYQTLGDELLMKVSNEQLDNKKKGNFAFGRKRQAAPSGEPAKKVTHKK